MRAYFKLFDFLNVDFVNFCANLAKVVAYENVKKMKKKLLIQKSEFRPLKTLPRNPF